MKFQTEMTVVGMKSSKGEFEGKGYDSTKLYALIDMDASKGTAKGQACAEYTFGDSTEFEKFKHLPFPFKALADVEMVTNGRTQKTVVVGIKPIDRAAKA
jgi:hypothetical protein